MSFGGYLQFPIMGFQLPLSIHHYSNVIMGAMASQITSLSIVCSTVSLGADQRKHQNSASLAFVRGYHQWLVNSPHKGSSNAENVFIWWRHHVEEERHEMQICIRLLTIIYVSRGLDDLRNLTSKMTRTWQSVKSIWTVVMTWWPKWAEIIVNVVIHLLGTRVDTWWILISIWHKRVLYSHHISLPQHSPP